MPARTKVKNLDEVLTWISEGRTYAWICNQYRSKYGIQTSPSMWAAIRRRQGLPRRVVRSADLIPWVVASQHRHSHAVTMLRAEARRRAGLDLTPRTASELTSWLERLKVDGTVVLYDRATDCGWRYVPRRVGIDRDLIREPDGHPGQTTSSGNITLSIVIAYADGTTVPFDPLLLV